MTRPDRDAIDTRGTPAQRASLRSAIEVAHGARQNALRDAARVLDDAAKSEGQQDGPEHDYCAEILTEYAETLRALAQSGAEEKVKE